MTAPSIRFQSFPVLMTAGGTHGFSAVTWEPGDIVLMVGFTSSRDSTAPGVGGWDTVTTLGGAASFTRKMLRKCQGVSGVDFQARTLEVWWWRATTSTTTGNIATNNSFFSPGFGTLLAAVLVVKDCPTSGDPFDGTVDACDDAANTAISCAAITTAADESPVFNVAASREAFGAAGNVSIGSWSNGALAGFAELGNVNNVDNVAFAIAAGVKSAAGSTGASTATGGNSAFDVTGTFALLAVPPPPLGWLAGATRRR